jgi:deoxyribonuclease-4
VERAATAGCQCVQLFTKNNNQWYARPITDEEVAAFRGALLRHNISHPLSHSSYLLNIASPQPALWKRSVEGLIVELQRAARLGMEGVVLHPGAAMGATDRAAIRRVVRALNEALSQTAQDPTRCLLETTAGQGSCIGCRFEHLAAILDRVRSPDRLGICFDTCHVFAAGYGLRSEEEYQHTMGTFDQLVGIDQIRAFHLNDSKTPLGSRVDRHEHIGRGALGRASFCHFIRDPRWHAVPMYLETPKGMERGRDLDRINLSRLRRMRGK